MNSSQVRHAGLPALVVVLALAAGPIRAQEPQIITPAPPPLCDPDAVGTTFAYADYAHGQVVSLHFQNLGTRACRLQGPAGPSFSVDGHSMYVGTCWLCGPDNRPSPMPGAEPADRVLLAAGAQATLDLYWSSSGASCQWADWVSFFVQWSRPAEFLFTPANWPMHVCSDVKSSGYRAGTMSPATGSVTADALRVSLLSGPVYSDEQASLHVELIDSTDASSDAVGCAQIYGVRQGQGQEA